VPAPDRDGHPPDPNRDRIAAERAKVQRLDGDAFVKPEMPEAARVRLVERGSIDRADARTRSNREAIEAGRVRLEGRVHCCE